MRRLRGTLSAHVSAEMSERSKEHDWKSCVPRKGTMGSNPILCAILKKGLFSLGKTMKTVLFSYIVVCSLVCFGVFCY